ncbi:113_t:CDS:2, partial [Paraglomus occultum]
LEATEIHIDKQECNWFTSLSEARKGYYNRPKSKTFASIDSLSFNGETLALYQITVSENHGIKKGLNEIDHSLTWKKDATNVNIYFVVPPDIFEKFTLQKYKTVKDEDYQRENPEWINEITQYVMEINLGVNNKSAKYKRRSNDVISGDENNDDKEVERKIKRVIWCQGTIVV